MKAGKYTKPVPKLTDLPDPKVVGGAAAVQSASYALEVLAGTYGSRASCFGVVVKDDKLFFWHYDASCIVYTTQILSFLLDFEGAAAAVVAIANCTPERFGGLPAFVMKPPQHSPENFPPPDLRGYSFFMPSLNGPKTYKLTLEDPLSVSYCLTGRRSFIYTANIDPVPADYPKKLVIVKFSYQVKTRKPEDEIVKLSHACGVEHTADIHACQDLWIVEDGTREVDNRLRATMEKYGLDCPSEDGNKKRYEDRVFRSIAYTAYGSIRDLFAKKWELIPIMVDQMIDCE